MTSPHMSTIVCSCTRPGCSHHAAPSGRLRKGKPTWCSRGRCVDHMILQHVEAVATSGESELDWTQCQHRDLGCRHLARQRGGGKCYACQAGSLPCVNAVRGCPSHIHAAKSKVLRACTRHGGVPCAFSSSINNSVDADVMSGIASGCSSTPLWRVCSRDGCFTFVCSEDENALCMPCDTGGHPCKGTRCFDRVTGSTSWCKKCIKIRCPICLREYDDWKLSAADVAEARRGGFG